MFHDCQTATTAPQDTLLYAPDFKDSAVATLNDVAYAIGGAIYLKCESWPIEVITAAASALDVLGDGLKAIGSTVLAAGQKVLDVPRALASTLESVVKLGVLGIGAWFAYEYLYKPKYGAIGSRGKRRRGRR